MTFEQARAASQAVRYRFVYLILGRQDGKVFIEATTKREAQFRADSVSESLRRRLRLARVIRLPHPPGTVADSRRYV